MAISPTYTWMLIFRLIQGLVSKASWLIGYILSKNACDCSWGNKGSLLPKYSQVGDCCVEKWTQLQDSVERFFSSCIKRISKIFSINSFCIPPIKKTMKSEMRVNMPSRFLYNWLGICVFCTLRCCGDGKMQPTRPIHKENSMMRDMLHL